jgi:glycosyltransferase involved in cell wall biosynthesis
MNGPSQHFRVAIVANSVWNLYKFRSGLTKALIAEGHQVFLVAPPDGTEGKLDPLRATFLPLHHLTRQGIHPLRELRLARELYLIYQKYSIECALHFTVKPVIYGSLAARWAGVKSIATLTGLGYTFLHGRFTAALMKRMYAFALRRTETIFYHNPDDRALLLAAGVGTPERSFVVGGSGLPLEDFPLQPYDLAVSGRFLFVGRLLADKGIREFVVAAGIVRKKHPEFSFHVVGAPDPGNPASISEEELAGWAAAGDVVFHGEVEDVRPHLTSASVVVLPSYREGCPRSLLEAAATGRALIGTDVPGVREMVLEGETGWLVAARDCLGLADGIVGAGCFSLGELKGYGRRSRILVEDKFGARRVNNAYLGALFLAV